MSFDGIVVGNYGQVAKLTVLDVDTDAAADLSAYATTQHMVIKDPDGNEATVTAAWDDDGTDGVVAYTLAENDIDVAGMWHIKAKAVLTGESAAILYSLWHSFEVSD